MVRFRLASSFAPRGDQPQAIEALVEGIERGRRSQVLLGVTGSGKTFTMANVIEQLQRPALVLAHNKTLAAQLYQEFKSFFPDNAVEYFVSYYDYYQPEAYIPRSDTYIEKDMAINDQIDRMRLSATRSLLERDDVIIVASVSCIYGLGTPEFFRGMNLELAVGQKKGREQLLLHLVEMHYKRNEYDLTRGTFRVRGELIDIFPAYEEALVVRLEFCDDELEAIYTVDPLTGRRLGENLDKIAIYPGSHHVTPEEVRTSALETIRAELKEREAYFAAQGQYVEQQRIGQRTRYDLEMIREIGFCKGIENYSRHFNGRAAGEPPPCLLDYFPASWLLFVDESHQTLPQMRAMYNGDRARKQALVDYGFRLPSAYDNRPLRFEESYSRFPQVIYVSATPADWEVEEAGGIVVEQIVRPTGLLDPPIEVRPAKYQVDNSLEEIQKEVRRQGRVLVTTLTKRLSEELASYLTEMGVKAKYLHSDIDTLERMQILEELRAGLFEVLIGINLLREGLDLPEVTLVLILDADKEGFLRSKTALIQTCGRAARNADGRVIMYGEKKTMAMEEAIAITERRRLLQQKYNLQWGITPKTVVRPLIPMIEEGGESLPLGQGASPDHKGRKEATGSRRHYTQSELHQLGEQHRVAMNQAADNMDYEEAARQRDLMRHYQQLEVAFGEGISSSDS